MKTLATFLLLAWPCGARAENGVSLQNGVLTIPIDYAGASKDKLMSDIRQKQLESPGGGVISYIWVQTKDGRRVPVQLPALSPAPNLKAPPAKAPPKAAAPKRAADQLKKIHRDLGRQKIY